MTTSKTFQDIILGNPRATTQPDGTALSVELDTLYDRTTALEAVTISGVTYGEVVDLATTANITLSGEQTIDGTLTSTSDVLVKDQTDASGNGVYTTAAGAWARRADMDAASKIAGKGFNVLSGTVNAGKVFATYSTVTTLGTDDIDFIEIGALGGGATLSSPTFTGTVTADNLTATGTVTLTGATLVLDDDAIPAAKVDGLDAHIADQSTPHGATAAGMALLTAADAGAQRIALNVPSTSGATLSGAWNFGAARIIGPTRAAGDNGTDFATTEFVQGAIASLATQAALNLKLDASAFSGHGHAISDVTGLDAALENAEKSGSVQQLLPGVSPLQFTDNFNGVSGTAPGASVVSTSDGTVRRLTSAATLAPLKAFRIEEFGHMAIRWVFRQSTAPADPAGEAVQINIYCRDAQGNSLPGQYVVNITPTTTDKIARLVLAGKTAGTGVDYVFPDSAVEFIPSVVTYGNSPVDVSQIDVGFVSPTPDSASASTSAALAQKWASEADGVVVADGEYSAKHYAGESQTSSQASASSAAASLVSSQSASSNNAAAATSASAAATSETNAATSETNAATSAAGAATSALTTTTAALANGKPIFADVSSGQSGTSENDYYLVLSNEELTLYQNTSGGGVSQGDLFKTPTSYKDAATLAASPLVHDTGEVISTRREGYVYVVAASGATDHDVTVGSLKLYVVPVSGEIQDRAWLDITNDADRVQTAINFCIAFAKANNQTLSLLCSGSYTMSHPILVADVDVANTRFLFPSLTIRAGSKGYLTNQKTTWNFTDRTEHGVAIHRGRSVRIENISIIGDANNNAFPTYEQLIARNNWWNPHGLTDGQYGTHTGIVVDPFNASHPSGEKSTYFSSYPFAGGADLYTYSSGGLTDLVVDNCELHCWLRGFDAAGSATQLGDSIRVTECNLSHNGIAIVVPESQVRGMEVIGCHYKANDTLFSANSSIGAGTGTGAFVRGGVSVYSYALADLSTSRGPISISQFYAESFATVGHFDGKLPATFNDCNFKFFDPHEQGVDLKAPDAHITGEGRVFFNGCYFGTYTNVPHKPVLANPNVFFSNTTFSGWPIQPYRETLKLDNCNSIYENKPIAQRIISDPALYLNTGSINAETKIFDGSEANPRILQGLSHGGAEYYGGGTVTLTTDDLATVSGIASAYYDGLQPGDYLGVLSGFSGRENSADKPLVAMNGGGVIGRVQSKSAGVVTLENVAYSLTNGSYQFYVQRPRVLRYFTFGDTTSGSDQITNVSVNGGSSLQSWVIGDFIRGAGIPAGSRITAKSGTTLTISQNATATATGIDLYDAQIAVIDAARNAAPTSQSWPTGAFVRNLAPTVDANDMLLQGWACTKGGTPGTWSPVYLSTVSPAA